jgi:hypothetical protein
MVGVILCSKARFLSAARTLSTSDISKSAARVSCLGADNFRQMREESDDVVLGFALDLVNPSDIENDIAGLGPDHLRSLSRNHAEVCQRIRRMRLDLEPDFEARLRLPDGGHFRAGVAGNH